MNMQQFTDECLKIHQDVSRRMPLTLKSDKSATLDKPERKTETLKFCIWGQSSGFCWDRNYASYHIIYDPAGNLDQKGLLQVRFMFFLNRKQTDKSLNQAVEKILYRLAGQRQFKFVLDDKIVFLYRPYYKLSSKWRKAVTDDLVWLINETLPRFDKLKSR